MDYKLKYLKYKQKYINLKKNKHGGDNIKIINSTFTKGWNNSNNEYDGTVEGELYKDIELTPNKIKKEGDGVWTGSWVDDNWDKNVKHYKGNFTERNRKKNKDINPEVNIIGKWYNTDIDYEKTNEYYKLNNDNLMGIYNLSPNLKGDSTDKFIGIRETNKPKKEPETLKNTNIEDNKIYSLKSFIEFKNLKSDTIFKLYDTDKDNYWTIKKVNNNYYEDKLKIFIDESVKIFLNNIDELKKKYEENTLYIKNNKDNLPNKTDKTDIDKLLIIEELIENNIKIENEIKIIEERIVTQNSIIQGKKDYKIILSFIISYLDNLDNFDDSDKNKEFIKICSNLDDDENKLFKNLIVFYDINNNDIFINIPNKSDSSSNTLLFDEKKNVSIDLDYDDYISFTILSKKINLLYIENNDYYIIIIILLNMKFLEK